MHGKSLLFLSINYYTTKLLLFQLLQNGFLSCILKKILLWSENFTMKLKERAKKLETDIPAIFSALKKKETPILAKVLAGITIAYILSPIDLIPDFIPVLGYLDDVILLPMLVALIIKMLPAKVLEECRKEAESIWRNGKPKKWYYALPILTVWLLVVVLIVQSFL